MKKYFAIIAIAVAALTGCKDFLEEAPILSQSDVLTLSTFDGLDKTVAGAYAPLASSSWYGSDWILYNEMKTSNGKKYIGSSFDSGRLNDYYNINYAPNNTSGVYSAAYYVISTVNNVMDAMDETKGTEKDRNNIKAECLFLRALSHFDAVLTYAQPYCFTADASHDGIPTVFHTESDARPERASVKEVYDMVIADLLEAEKIIDPKYVRAGVTDVNAVVSLPVIQALLSRVYLYKGDWQNAAEYATKVIDCGKYELWNATDLKEAACYCQDCGSKEVIFEVYASTGNSYDPNGDHVGLFSMTTPYGYADAGCSTDIINLYETSDARLGLYMVDESGSCFFTAKDLGKGLYASDDPVNTIVIRLSEMYLNRAEALINGAKVKDAEGVDISPAADLALIASSRGASAQTATPSGVALERQKELAWEGHLFFDLGRTKTDMTRVDVGADNIIKNLPWGDDRWAMPIPEHETNANKNIKQNPGY